MRKTKGKRKILATAESVAKLSIFFVSFLIVIKVVASIVTGSIGIRADAAHSIIDLIGVVTGYLGIRISGKPPDMQHSFGHNKAEDISGFVISILILIAAATITYEAVKRLIASEPLELITIGIYVTAVAIVINLIIAWYALRVARSADSIALEATGLHMLADVWSSCAVLAGLILVRLTGLAILDPIAAMLVAVLIARTGYLMMKKSFGELMDVRLPEAEENVIRECIMEHFSEVISFHALRSRKAGSHRYIDLHLVMRKEASVEEVHRTCDCLEKNIGNRLSHTDVTIHVEPCEEECGRCSISCSLRKERR